MVDGNEVMERLAGEMRTIYDVPWIQTLNFHPIYTTAPEGSQKASR